MGKHLFNGRFYFPWLFNANALNTHTACHFNKVQRRVREIKAQWVVMCGYAKFAPVLLNVELQESVGGIIADNKLCVYVVSRCCPKCLNRVHGTTITSQPNNRTVWIGPFCADGARSVLDPGSPEQCGCTGRCGCRRLGADFTAKAGRSQQKQMQAIL